LAPGLSGTQAEVAPSLGGLPHSAVDARLVTRSRSDQPGGKNSRAANGSGARLILAPSRSGSRVGMMRGDRFAPGTAPGSDPVRVILSNDPEKVCAPRVLLHRLLPRSEPTNLLWHHIGVSDEPLRIIVRLVNSGAGPARIFVVGAHGGPSRDEIFVGHVIMKRFLGAWLDGIGSVFEVPAYGQVDLSRLLLARGSIVGGLAQLTVLEGDNVRVECLASGTPNDGAGLGLVRDQLVSPLPIPLELPGSRELTITQVVGKAWSFLRIGNTHDSNLHTALRGEYGVVYRIEVVFEKPSETPARLEIALRSGAGPGRGNVNVNGKSMETRLLNGGGEAILYEEVVQGAGTYPATVVLMPQAASNYPMTLVARSFPARERRATVSNAP